MKRYQIEITVPELRLKARASALAHRAIELIPVRLHVVREPALEAPVEECVLVSHEPCSSESCVACSEQTCID